MTRPALCLCVATVGFLAASAARSPAALQRARSGPSQARDRLEEAYRASNLGVARLEQFDFDAAAASFRDALKIDPSLGAARVNLAIALLYGGGADAARTEAAAAAAALPDAPQPPYVLGLIAKAQNRPEDAIAAFRRVLRVDPADAATKVNLAQLYLQERDATQAVSLFKEALDAEPYNVTAAYGLATALLRAGQADAGRQAMQRFQALRDSTYGVTYAQTYLQQGRYAEAIVSTGAEPGLVDERTPQVVFSDATPAALSGTNTGFTLADVNGDGRLDLLAVTPGALRLYVNHGGTFTDGTAAAKLDLPLPGTGIGAVVGDYDNDGKADVFLLRNGGNRLLRQRADGTFEDVTAAAGIAPPTGPSRSAAFVDVDHDGDLDIVIAGWGAPNQLLRNNGNGTFTDIATTAGVRGSAAHALAIVPTDFDNRRDIDLLLINQDGPAALFQNMRDGSFRDAAAQTGLQAPGGSTAVAAGDVNKDGFTDFFLGRVGKPGVFALSDGHGGFTMQDGPAESADAAAVQLFDYDNDGLLDLLVSGPRGTRLLRNAGNRWIDVTRESGVGALTLGGASPVREFAVGDLDDDGDSDVVALTAGGALRVWRNDGGNRQPSVRVRLAARVSNRGGLGSKVEMRAGSLRQKLETSSATPAVAPADLLFGLGARAAADIVRVLWPSGILQTEIAPAGPATGTAAPMTITELDRKPSSCPFLFTWNGTRFEFVTDFMGGGEMGDWVAPGVWNLPDPDEYVRIRGDQLQPRDGRYELRITNELEEAIFLDRLQLVAVDHPADVDVFPNEGLRNPPRPAFRLFAARKAHAPLHAVDEHGHDVLPRIASVDRRYPDDFLKLPIRGYAEPHTLTLDLGPDSDRALLLLTGWTDYAYSSDNIAARQAGLAMRAPSLQVKDAGGAWRTVIEDLGFPVGRPQTVPVDLTGRFIGPSREVRIVTNMPIYWDQILVDPRPGTYPMRITRLDPLAATLRSRGFSAETSPDGREPYGYDYARVSAVSPWKQPAGTYTRYGDVRPLLRQTDDMYAIAGPGDEIAVSFDAKALPPPARGRARTFLLYADGFSKEMNIRSATPDAIAPLPFHSMRRYPYGADEHYPRSRAHAAYRARYNTRVVASPVPSLDRSAAGVIPRR
jgi:cytochrome c-type biogenesis protein CcmH/NrfG